MLRDLIEKFNSSCITDTELSELVGKLNEIIAYKNEWLLDFDFSNQYVDFIDLIEDDSDLIEIVYDRASKSYFVTVESDHDERSIYFEDYVINSEEPMVSLGRQLHLTRAEILRNEVDRLENFKVYYQNEISRSEQEFKSFQMRGAGNE